MIRFLSICPLLNLLIGLHLPYKYRLYELFTLLFNSGHPREVHAETNVRSTIIIQVDSKMKVYNIMDIDIHSNFE